MDAVVTAIERVIKGSVKSSKSNASQETEEFESGPSHVESRL